MVQRYSIFDKGVVHYINRYVHVTKVYTARTEYNFSFGNLRE